MIRFFDDITRRGPADIVGLDADESTAGILYSTGQVYTCIKEVIVASGA